MLLEFEELIKAPETVTKKRLDFLELNDFEFELIHKNNLIKKTYFSPLGYFIKNNNLVDKIRAITPFTIDHFVKELLNKSKFIKNEFNTNLDVMSEVNMIELAKFYQEDLEKLKKNLNFKPKYWAYTK